MALTDVELRVLGALIEKERTTPDGYPLSSQALLTACNQKTSREPVTDYHLQDVLAAMARLRDRGLAETVRTVGDRVPKHRHKAAEALGLDDGEAAVLAVLMLRGPQTPGELRTRTERYVAFGNVEDVERVLEELAARGPALVECLGRRPGQSQDRWCHALGSDPERLAPRVRRPRDGEAEPSRPGANGDTVPGRPGEAARTGAGGARALAGGDPSDPGSYGVIRHAYGAAQGAATGNGDDASQDKVAELEARVAALESRLAELERHVAGG